MKIINATVKKAFKKFQSEEIIPVGTPVTLVPHTGMPADPNGYVQYTLRDGYSSRIWGIPNAIIHEYFSPVIVEHSTKGFKNADGFVEGTGFSGSSQNQNNFHRVDGFNETGKFSYASGDMMQLFKSIPTASYAAGAAGALAGAAIAHQTKGGWVAYMLWALGLGLGAGYAAKKITEPKNPSGPRPMGPGTTPPVTQTTKDNKEFTGRFIPRRIPGKKQLGTGELGFVPVVPSNVIVGGPCGSGLGTWQSDGGHGYYCASKKNYPLAVS